MRGFASNSNPGTPAGVGDGSPGLNHTPATPAPELDRPEVEALTPPGYPQAPAGEPVPELELGTSNGGGNDTTSPEAPTQSPPVAGSDLLSSLATSSSYTSYGRAPSAASGGSTKKRKLNSGDEFLDFGGGDAMDGLDADVAEMLRRDSGSGAS
jgi:regulator of Ty1 transposition protein 103